MFSKCVPGMHICYTSAGFQFLNSTKILIRKSVSADTTSFRNSQSHFKFRTMIS